ncbi:MAG: HAMP domain-containing sensor histidine kinase [Kineosporiaceae bacterium]
MISRPGLRWRAALAFGAGAVIVAAVLAASTYLLSRSYLVHQREASALRQAFADASFVRDRLVARAAPRDVVADVVPRTGARALLEVDGAWYGTDLTDASGDLPPEATAATASGRAMLAWWRGPDGPLVVVGTPLPEAGARYYEVSAVTELDRTLRQLRRVLAVGAVLTAAAAAAVGRIVARRVLQPLDDVAAAAAGIAAGRLDTRLARTDDPDLIAIVAAFNTMADAVSARLQREARFTADVSHELRSPLTTLVAGVDLLERRREELPERSRKALDLVRAELDRFRRTLDDLLALARLDAERDQGATPHTVPTDLATLVGHVLDRAPSRPAVGVVGSSRPTVLVDRRHLERVVENLLENADRYGGGATAVEVEDVGGWAELRVDDAGPGVAETERERIFSRFARGPASRGSTAGTGLGLSLVREAVEQHGGTTWCTDSPGGGARFVVRLPTVEEAS